MSQKNAQFESQARPGALVQLGLLQLVCTVCFSLTLYYCFDTREALSALLGGAIAALASFFFAGRLYSSSLKTQNAAVIQEPTAAGSILVRFYFSVVLKVLFTLMMMAICIIVLKVSMLPFIIAFLLAAVIVNLCFIFIDARSAVGKEKANGQ